MYLRSLAPIMLLACAPLAVPTAAKADVVTVFVFNFEFSILPPTQFPLVDPTITVGDTIRWQWLTGGHNVVAAANQAESFRSQFLSAGGVFQHTFNRPGEFYFFCEPHGQDQGDGTATGMAGIVTVLPIPVPSTLALFPLAVLTVRRRR